MRKYNYLDNEVQLESVTDKDNSPDTKVQPDNALKTVTDSPKESDRVFKKQIDSQKVIPYSY